MVRLDENSLSFNQLNTSRADIPIVLGNDFGEVARSTQPVTLYITVNIAPQNRERMSPTEDFLFALDRANETMKAIVPFDQSTTWERTVERIDWVMDSLSPIAEVRVMPFCCPRLG